MEENQKQIEVPATVQPAAMVPSELLSLGRSPAQIILEAHLAAEELMKVVEHKPAVIINGERYLELEDWATVARFFGLTSGIVPESTTYVEYGDKSEEGNFVYGFKSTAYLLDLKTNQKISHAESMCLSDEPKWRRKPLYQLSSMSQTRAQSKVMRNVLSFIVVLAGYKPTPAEEMTEVNGRLSVDEAVLQASASYYAASSVDPNNLVPALEESVKEVDRKKKLEMKTKADTLHAAKNMKELAAAWTSLTKDERKALKGIKDGCKSKLTASQDGGPYA